MLPPLRPFNLRPVEEDGLKRRPGAANTAKRAKAAQRIAIKAFRQRVRRGPRTVGGQTRYVVK